MSKLTTCLQMLLVFSAVSPGFMTARAENLVEPTEQLLSTWRDAIRNTPVPLGGYGCFHAAYPETTWTPVGCDVATDTPFRSSPPETPPPQASGKNPGAVTAQRAGNSIQNVGGGNSNDWMTIAGGVLPNGYPIAAYGSFPVVSGVTSEYDGSGAPIYNDYSVQLNSNEFSTPACNNHTGCLGWEQFVYSSGQQQLLIQYWLLLYGKSCPTTWKSAAYGSCYKTDPAAVHVPTLAATGLASLSMDVQSSGISPGSNGPASPTRVWLYIGSNAYYTSDSQTDTLNLTQGWYEVEFNVFGDANSLTANFNAGSSITVQTSISDPPFNNGLPNAQDSCVGNSYTGEQNNLTLGSCTSTAARYVTTSRGRVPQPSYISFTESN